MSEDRELFSDLLARWEGKWQAEPTSAHELRAKHTERWVRFRSLPDSKRYPQDEAEYKVILERHNTVLDELFTGQDVCVITTGWSDPGDPAVRSDNAVRLHPSSELWTSSLTDEPDPEYRICMHSYISCIRWQPACLDPLLRSVADDVSAGLIITDTNLDQLYHPYDGGADVILTDSASRDAMRERYSGWLSKHPQGL
ncbi:hypothetical protein ACIQZB_37550 [Streptomyces sp. NPDC097727]|uniref:DUF3885 domain-containing protein n=1 Tax=Streptomyces sp. NPDC097727 TaxID=3366092 RepID=UPI00380CDCBC